MGFCAKLSSLYFNLVSFLSLVLSLVIIGYAGYLASQLSDFKDIINTGAILVPLIFGVCLFVISIIGLIGAHKNLKVLLIIYLVFLLIATVAVFASGIAILVTSGVLAGLASEIGRTDELNVAAGTTEAGFVDLQLLLFNACCATPFGLTPGVVTGDASVSIPSTVCDALGGITVDVDGTQEPLVGDPASAAGGCADGNSTLFVEVISTFIESNIRPLGAVNVAMAVLLFLDFVACCVLLCCGGKKKTAEEIDAEKQRKAQEEYDLKAGPELAR